MGLRRLRFGKRGAPADDAGSARDAVPASAAVAVADPPATQQPAPSDRGVRYLRGAPVLATDGEVGTLRQVVVDEEEGAIRALVVRREDTGVSVLVPPDLVTGSADGALLLGVDREQFHSGAEHAPRHDPRMFVAADLRRITRLIPLVFAGDRRRSLVTVSAKAAETSDSLDALATRGR